MFNLCTLSLVKTWRGRRSCLRHRALPYQRSTFFSFALTLQAEGNLPPARKEKDKATKEFNDMRAKTLEMREVMSGARLEFMGKTDKVMEHLESLQTSKDRLQKQVFLSYSDCQFG